MEDQLALRRYFNVLPYRDEKIDHYLQLTSLPFVAEGLKHVPDIEQLWSDIPKSDTLVYRPTQPTGNLHPRYMIVGDAPGVGDGPLTDRFDRVLVYGPSSRLLRKALLELGVYYSCWFTNLLKLSTPNNRPSTAEEIEAHREYLETEVRILRPRKVILLGRHVSKMFPLDIPTVSVPHPSWGVRMSMGAKDYAKKLEGIK